MFEQIKERIQGYKNLPEGIKPAATFVGAQLVEKYIGHKFSPTVQLVVLNPESAFVMDRKVPKLSAALDLRIEPEGIKFIDPVWLKAVGRGVAYDRNYRSVFITEDDNRERFELELLGAAAATVDQIYPAMTRAAADRSSPQYSTLVAEFYRKAGGGIINWIVTEVQGQQAGLDQVDMVVFHREMLSGIRERQEIYYLGEGRFPETARRFAQEYTEGYDFVSQVMTLTARAGLNHMIGLKEIANLSVDNSVFSQGSFLGRRIANQHQGR